MAMREMFSRDAMRRLWADAALYEAMMRFELELSAAQAAAGLIPANAAKAIALGCAGLENVDWSAISADARTASTAAIPFIKALKSAVADIDPQSAPFVHYGSTSQDVCETALLLQAQKALAMLHAQATKLGDALAALVKTHGRTEMVGRTLLQPSAPISFGWKAAGWLDSWGRCAVALRRAGDEARVIQFGGSNGTLSSLGEHGPAIGAAVAAALGLSLPPIAWQSARDRLARLGNEIALCCAMLGKLGRDISLMMQSEVAEAFEPSGAGRGGSSAMPHKRNPVACMHMLDAALRAPPLALSLVSDMTAEHERGLGSWPNALPLLADLFMLLDNALSMAVETMEGLRVHPESMQSNLASRHGVIYSEGVNMLLGSELGSEVAQRVVDTLCKHAMETGADFCGLVSEHPEVKNKIARGAIERICSPQYHAQAAERHCAAVLSAWEQRRHVLNGGDSNAIRA